MSRWCGADPRGGGASQHSEHVGGLSPRLHLPPHGEPEHPLEPRQLVRGNEGLAAFLIYRFFFNV